MTPGARLSAAIEVLADIENRRRPAGDALKDWGLAHRFAGSSDRAAIGGLVFDALRRRSSAAWLMGASTPRAILFGALRLERGLSADKIARLADGGRYAPPPPDAAEAAALAAPALRDDVPAHVRGDYPEWLDPHFAAVFGDERAEEGAAMSRRAPVDLRVNTLKGDRSAALAALAHLTAVPTPWSPAGLRIPLTADAKSPPLQAEPAFLGGLIEVQDEGSQLAAQLAAAQPGETVVDLCAGGGGKTLALAALMKNSGRIVATDADIRRLAPIHARLARAGVTNVDVRTPRGHADVLADIRAADLVLIDAPCTGVGAWRRNPDAKWRIRPGALAQRIKAQDEALARAAMLVRPGGRIAYVTCSVLDEENGARVRAFVGRHPNFVVVSAAAVTTALGDAALRFEAAVRVSAEGILMTPRRTGTDGFFVSVLRCG